MGSTEARVDYMGSSILMGVFSNADLQLQDEWKVNLCTVDTSLSEKRYAAISAGAYHAVNARFSILASVLMCRFVECHVTSAQTCTRRKMCSVAGASIRVTSQV